MVQCTLLFCTFVSRKQKEVICKRYNNKQLLIQIGDGAMRDAWPFLLVNKSKTILYNM